MKQIKLPWLIAAVAIMLLATYAFILRYEMQIVHFYTKLFPDQKHKSIIYWQDLTDLLFTEMVMLGIFAITTVYVTRKIDVSRLVEKSESLFLKKPSLTLWLIVVSFFIVALYAAVYVLDEFPNSADEYAYLFQAEVLSRGKLWDTAHPLKDFFQFHHIAQVGDVWISRFPPGWPLVLAIAFIVNIPAYIINPVLGAITLIVLYKFCIRFYDQRVAFWSTIITAFSACVILNAGSFFSHTSSLLELLLFIYLMYLYLDEKKFYQAVLAGFCLGLLVITRYFTAFLVFIPFFVYLVYHHKFKAFVPLVLIGIGSIPPMLYLLWYNYAITGNPLVPVTMWAYDDEALGFVNGHTVGKGFQFIVRRIMMFVAWISPAALILYFVFLWKKIKSKSERLTHPEDYWLLFLAVGYFFYYHHGGNQYGPRFYFEAIPFVIIFVVSKVIQSNYKWAYAMMLTGFIYALVKIPIIGRHEYKVVQERQDIYAKVKDKGIHNAVVFVSSGTGLLRPMPQRDLSRNDKDYNNDVIYAQDLKERNIELMDYYKGRAFYYYKRQLNNLEGELVEVKPEEGESKSHPEKLLTKKVGQ
jgi:hypothetical protein